ncbi:MAG: cell division protein ZapA [Chitinophagaceae bacterium]|nr:cell division protein ZapA [Chitinophagaceae bacterium]
MEDALIPVNVVVGDRTYRVRIEPRHEEVVRATVKVINDKLLEFKTSFAGKDMQDYIAMVVLWYATTAAEEGGTGNGKGAAEQLSAFESILDRALG